MAEQQKDMSGVLFKNDKGDNEKRPDYTGKASIGGTEYYISAWINESKKGTKYFGLSFNLPKENTTSQKATTTDDIPF
tara:strand:+ start:1183 stop:1416 length:234 start_codon:yes stop_codon:yes gene_type:complete